MVLASVFGDPSIMTGSGVEDLALLGLGKSCITLLGFEEDLKLGLASALVSTDFVPWLDFVNNSFRPKGPVLDDLLVEGGGTLRDLTEDFVDVSLHIEDDRLVRWLLIDSLSDSEAVLDFRLDLTSVADCARVMFFLNLDNLSSEVVLARCAKDSEATLIDFWRGGTVFRFSLGDFLDR